MTAPTHDQDVHIGTYVDQLHDDLDMDKHRIALGLTTTMGQKYFVAEVLEEWDNAIRFMPEGDGAQPVLVFKQCIETIHVVSRPLRRRNQNDE